MERSHSGRVSPNWRPAVLGGVDENIYVLLFIRIKKSKR